MRDPIEEWPDSDHAFEIVDQILARHPDLWKHRWAVRIVFRHFRKGLLRLVESREMVRRYSQFLRNGDPIYRSILKGLQDAKLASTFVGFWKIAHTMATQSRFWLEDAIAEIVERDPQWEGTDRKVYNDRMLAAGLYVEGRSMFDLGDDEREDLLSIRRPWRVPVERRALEVIDRIVGDQELVDEPRRKEEWDSDKAVSRDLDQLRAVAESLVGPPPTDVNVHCNLLVVEPDHLDQQYHVWAFRFVNPTTFGSHAVRKQERINLLRLYAYLAQEKPLRDPRQIHVSVAEVVPRPRQRDRVTYFSSQTYWDANRLWDHLNVPFEAVRLGIAAAGSVLGQSLNEGLRGLLPENLPESETKLAWDSEADDGWNRPGRQPVSADQAREVGLRHLLEHASDGVIGQIGSVLSWDEIRGRKPMVYGKTEEFWKRQWIVYLRPSRGLLGSSYIIAVDRQSGAVTYSGPANDEG